MHGDMVECSETDMVVTTRVDMQRPHRLKQQRLGAFHVCCTVMLLPPVKSDIAPGSASE